MSKYLITPERKTELENRLIYLKDVKLKKIHEDIKYYRSFCNFTEDTPFDETLDKQYEVQQQIKTLENILAEAEINTSKQPQTEVKVGNEVTFEEIDSGEQETYTLVNPIEADPLKHYISIRSPIGQSLLHQKLNDIVHIDTPARMIKVKIINIR